MADISTPKEFLQEALQIVDSLDADRSQLTQASEASSRLEKDLAALTRNIIQEKDKTIDSRRADVEKEYSKKIRGVESEISSIENRRARARQEAVKDRVMNQTAGLKGEIASLQAQLQAFCKEQKLPGYCTTRLYYHLFCPKHFGEWLALLIIAALMIAALVVPVVFFDKLMYSGIALIVDIILLFLYFMIFSKTRGKHSNEINYCRQIVDRIYQDEKGVRQVTKNINMDKDDSPYDLSSFDSELAAKKQEKNNLEQLKTSALYQFDNVTKQQIISEIDSTYAERLTAAQNDAAQAKAVVGEYTQKVAVEEDQLNANYLQYLGSRNLSHEAIEKMIGLLDNGEAASVTDAVTRLNSAGK